MPKPSDPLTQWRESQLSAGVKVDEMFGQVAAELLILGVMRGLSPEQCLERVAVFTKMYRESVSN